MQKQSKKQTSTPQAQTPERNVQPVLIIQPSQYKQMIMVDRSILVHLEKLYITEIKPTPGVNLNGIRAEIKQLYKIFEESLTYKNEIDSLKVQNQNQMQVIMSKDNIIRNIEDTYQDQMSQISLKAELLNKELQQELLQLRIENAQMKASLMRISDHHIGLEERNRQLEEESNILQSRLNLAEIENKRLSDELTILKDLRFTSITQKLISPFDKIEHAPLVTIFRSTNLISYLKPKDLLSIMQTNRQLYFTIKQHNYLQTHVTRCNIEFLKTANNYLLKENNYFYDKVAQIPDEVIQIGVAKFLAFKFQAGQYMIELFNDIFEFIEGRVSNQQQQIQNTYESEDLIGLNDSQVEEKKPEVKSSFMDKFKSIKSDLTKPKQNKTSLSDISLQIQSEFRGLDHLIIEALQVPFLRAQMIQTRRDMNELVKRSQDLNYQLFQAGSRCIPTASNPFPQHNMQDFMKQLQNNFARLVTYSHYLQLECQQLQQLSQYLAKNLTEQNSRISQLNLSLEDRNEELKSLKEMRIYLQGRARSLEDRVYKCEEEQLLLKNQNMELQKTIAKQNEQIQQINNTVKEKDEKLSKLVSLSKQLRSERDQFQKYIHDAQSQLQQLKQLIPELIIQIS